MQIDSSLSGYHYPTRPQMIERITEEPAQREVEQPFRSGSTLTGSSTLLSSSLASALWGLRDSGQAPAAINKPSNVPDVPVDWVQELYQEFSGGR
ncbi:hypothetical protein LH464_09700 [Neorhizobium sp. T786]|uniref:hypothetical protein n=1 Tax=Pseudorhizobium xiangyangii TaxID=2883104 RepID=UPI001CFF950F|nr:hypothetical protein [Neorhizobium xiangyangii]MCB5202746.1 hypothetical protein [Neorhizobium xiangyangii]